jgi:hypothetical protein
VKEASPRAPSWMFLYNALITHYGYASESLSDDVLADKELETESQGICGTSPWATDMSP